MNLRNSRLPKVNLLVAFALLASLQIRASASHQVASNAHYAKYEYMIPMRDGVKLYTAVYVPLDVPGEHPILLERSPYSSGPYGKAMRREPVTGKWHDAGYIFAYQDVRGRYLSEGDFVDIRPQLPEKHGPTEIDESTDTYDTVDYLVKNVPSNSHRVGLRGISYPGFYAEIGTVHTHPALKAASPQAPVSEWFMGDDWHHNGVLFQQDGFDFMGFFGPVRKGPSISMPGLPPFPRGDAGAYAFYLKTGAMPNFDKLYYKGRIPYWNEVLSHETYDAWWKARSVPGKLKDIHCALLFVGGFYDAEDCYGALNSFQASRVNKVPDFLVMGPWFHGMWAGPSGKTFGDLDFEMPTSTWFQDKVEFPFFEKYLRGDESVPAPALATMFETGSNEWRTFNEWPPKNGQLTDLFLLPNHQLSLANGGEKGADTYEEDPAAPTPYTEDLTLNQRPSTYMIADQRFASKRSDVLTYTSEVLTKDMTIGGPIFVNLVASTTGTDADFVVKLIDVYPDDTKDKTTHGESMAGYQRLIRGDVMRGKFRNSFSNPSPFVPGAPAKVNFKMNDVLHKFKAGHRLMVQIQSAWFPLVNRNPNVFTNINTADDAAYQKAKITIYSGPGGSKLHFTVIQ